MFTYILGLALFVSLLACLYAAFIIKDPNYRKPKIFFGSFFVIFLIALPASWLVWYLGHAPSDSTPLLTSGH